jgi:tryptophanyl-tRNA synthetase
MTDDEKFLWKGHTLEEGYQYLRNNAKGWFDCHADQYGLCSDSYIHAWYGAWRLCGLPDIIALGFDINKTFIFSNIEYIGHLYPTILSIERTINANQVKKAFGFNDTYNIGQFSFPAIQAAPSFPTAFKIPLGGRTDLRCLIPCAIDQVCNVLVLVARCPFAF